MGAHQNDRHSTVQPARPLPPGPLSAWPWLTFVAPFVVFLLVTSLEPKPAAVDAPAHANARAWWEPGISYEYYPWVYTAKLTATAVAMLLVVPGYRTFAPLRVSALAVLLGVAGGGVWIALSELHWEPKLLDSVGLGGILKLEQRSAFDPLTELDGAWAYGFLVVRFVGLVLIVPVIEEFFLRGFLMRYITAHNWWVLPFGEVTGTALIAGTVVPMLYHPEMLAALVWFSAISYLMLKTRNIWDCVLAHAVTNLVLGLYVVASGNWALM